MKVCQNNSFCAVVLCLKNCLRIKENISIERNLRLTSVQLLDYFRAGQELKHVINSIVQMSLKHYVALYSLTHSMDYTYIDKDWPVLKNNIYSPCSHTLPQI